MQEKTLCRLHVLGDFRNLSGTKMGACSTGGATVGWLAGAGAGIN